MAQFAVHAAIGVLAGDCIRADRPLRFGLVLGSVAPDLDFVPLITVYLFNPELARSFHRSASHSLFLPVGVLGICAALSLATGRRAIWNWGAGLALGLASHVVLDVLFWFDRVKVLWPLDLWGVSTTLDLWKHCHPSEIVSLLVGPSAEFLCYGLFFWFLRRRARHFGTDASSAPQLRVLEPIAYLLFGIFLVLVFLLPASQYEEVAYGTAAILFGPLALYLMWRLRRTIAGSASGQTRAR